MARPRDADSAETVRSIVEAALALIAELDNSEKLSMRLVASRSGLSLGTIQYYFSSKEELLEACLDDYYVRLAGIASELMQAVQGTPSPRTVIERTVRTLYRFLYRERALVHLRLSTNLQRGQLHPRRQRDFMGSLITEAARVVKPCVEIEEAEIPLAIQAASAIMVRSALLSESERAILTGLHGDAAVEAVEEYVVRAGRRLFRPSDG